MKRFAMFTVTRCGVTFDELQEDDTGEWVRIEDVPGYSATDDAIAEQIIRELSQELEAQAKRLADATALLDALNAAVNEAIRNMLSGGHPFEKGVALAINGLRAAQKSSTPSPPAEPACPHCTERISGHDPECPTLRSPRTPVLRPEFVALGEALGMARPKTTDRELSRVDELERANQRIIGAERLLLRASRVVELDDWRDDYDAWMSSTPAEPAPTWRIGTDTLEEWRSAGKAVGVSSPGSMQQAKHMAVAACEALGLKYDETSPSDIREAVYAESAPEKKAEPAPSLVEQIEAELERWPDAESHIVLSRIRDLLRATREAGGR